MAKPASHISWTDGSPSKVVEPSAAKKLLGWTALERPPFEIMNFLFFRLDEWVKYLEEVTDSIVGSKIIVVDPGGSGSFIDYQSAHDDAGTTVGSKILIVDDLLINSTQTCTKNDIEVEMRPGKRFKNGGSGPDPFKAFSIGATAKRSRFLYLAFGSDTPAERFADAGDECLVVEAGADDVFLFNPTFVTGNTTDLVDNGTNTVIVGGQDDLAK